MTSDDPRDAAPSEWLSMQERGTVFGIRLLLLVARLLGRPVALLITRMVALYFALADATVRRASVDFLRRAGTSHTFRAHWRHVYRFAQCNLDRLYMITGDTRRFRMRSNGNELLQAQQRTGRGALLLGAHMGSFDAMRARGRDTGLRIDVVGFFRNAARINRVLRALDPGSAVSLIEIDPDSMDAILAIRDRVEAGHLVAILADRVGLGKQTVPVQFLGETVFLPAGPFLMAHALRCPVYLTFGIYTDPNCYEFFCEPFADPLVLPRATRADALRTYAQRYADRLAEYCTRWPDNWFNFFDYWASARAQPGGGPSP